MNNKINFLINFRRLVAKDLLYNKPKFFNTFSFTNISIIDKIFRKEIKEVPNVPLGRWKIDYGNDEIIKQTLASHDHCGCCGTPENIKYEKILENYVKNKVDDPDDPVANDKISDIKK